jgi:methylmalonyl-CoA/ethylmalonyl-CoA epimerase
MKIHHFGILVANIDRDAPPCAVQFGLRPVSPIIHDPVQRADVQFWGNDGETVLYEFVQASSEDSPVRRARTNGAGIAHLCFQVPDIRAAAAEAQRRGAILVCAPVPAVAFDNHEIAFLFFRGMGLVEFVQEPPG